ncbi:exodeoxyribonuclease V subunit gamma [Candidatus Pantoea edessiphila]|uniref:RecBCD enzyme subunit RecC n=1 Tax=Candidatus Pantoea edessiphila TaxID=2044610 RepID=A0A2P5SXK9_9GAMM|nr:exodeoxyribonuclease V subunit gamma [Candidatus Pantoea edessiphila]MBK4775691.1 exodeoxyribonuclease V subunit gamma [Pantoea sp. Edef]PPI87078.1 exodeoxyribonuclease V subunit gamma [Candidatus Pantoea edessiphila]
MLYIYHSNQLNILKKLLNTIINRKLSCDHFAAEYILVKDLDVARWLKTGISLQFNIAANIKCNIFEKFIWDIMYKISPEVIPKNFSNKNNIIFMILSRIPKILKTNDFHFLSNYLDNCRNKNNLFHFSEGMANIFEKYIIYRPDWLQTWANGKLIDNLGNEQLWQAAIWQDLISFYGIQLKKYSFQQNNFYSLFIKKLHQNSNIKEFLPPRLFVFGISSFSPYYIKILNEISCYIDIHLFISNPCRNYWGDIQEHIILPRKSKNHQQIIDQDLINISSNYWSEFFRNTYKQHINNPLLVSWGKLGCDNLFLLNQLESSNHDDIFVDINEDNLLHCIQSDILNLKNSSVIGLSYKDLECNNQKRCIYNIDRSISINVCHTIQREVEVLQNYLVELINSDSNLNVNDIIVMVADIDIYIPFIKSTFYDKSIKKFLPVTILDHSITKENPIVIVFLKLLSLDNNNYILEDILSLLDVKSLADHFFIEENQLILLQYLIDNNYTYEKLNEFKILLESNDIENNHRALYNTKEILLDHLSEYSKNILSSNIPINDLLSILLKNLEHMILKINSWSLIFKKSYLLKDWLPLCRQLIDDFFNINNKDESESIFFFIEYNWKKLIYNSKKFIFEKISIVLLKNIFINQLDQENNNKNFLPGKINFCELNYIRSLPFKVICLLGMNKDDYPRKPNLSELNLMYQQPRKGDSHLIDEDRYLFLDILISAKNKLYLSYIGRSVKDNTECYPSILVTELLEYIGQNFYLKGDENIKIDDSYKNVKKYLLQYHNRLSCTPNNFKANFKTSKIFVDEQLTVAQVTKLPQCSFVNALTTYKVDYLKINQLLYFWSHPVRAWFNKRLKVLFPLQQYSSKNISYHYEDLKLYRTKYNLLNALIEKNNDAIQNIYNHNKVFGYLPPGVFAELFWNDLKQQMQQIAIKVIDDLRENNTWEINLKLQDLTLIGSLKQVQSNGLIRWSPNILTIKDGLLLLLEHLIYCATGGNGNSKMIGMSKSYWYFHNIQKNKSIDFLNKYITGYLSGMTNPLLLFNKIGSTWLRYCYNKKTKKLITDKFSIAKAHNKLLIALNGEYNILSGENKDPYVQRLYRNLGDLEIKQIKKSAEIWYLPVLQAHQDMKW